MTLALLLVAIAVAIVALVVTLTRKPTFYVDGPVFTPVADETYERTGILVLTSEHSYSDPAMERLRAEVERATGETVLILPDGVRLEWVDYQPAWLGDMAVAEPE